MKNGRSSIIGEILPLFVTVAFINFLIPKTGLCFRKELTKHLRTLLLPCISIDIFTSALLPHVAHNYIPFLLISAGDEPDTGTADQVTPGELLPEQEASIILPDSLFERIMNTPVVGMTFGIYSETVLFPVGKGSAESKSIEGRKTRVGSLIASATVGVNQRFQNLQDPVLNTFQLQIPPGMVRLNKHFT